MSKYTIKNRKKQHIVVLVDEIDQPKGLSIIMHGLSGNKEEPHIIKFAEAFNEEGFTTVRFDTTNTFGESDGKYEDATITSYYEDLEDVIDWCKKQTWYQEPFYLAGHSLGGISIALYAEEHPEQVEALAPISTVVSGFLRTQTEHHASIKEQWRKTGWLEEESKSVKGLIKKLRWSHIVDSLQYDLLPQAAKLTMPVLLIVGEKDTLTPLSQQQLLFEALPAQKELHVIKDAPHTFRTPEHLQEVKRIFIKWIRTNYGRLPN